VLRGAPESEDAVQQTFVKVLSSLPQTDVRLLAQWIHTIAYRTALEFLKKKLKKNEFALTEVEDLPMRSVPIDEQLERDNRAAIVENAIYGLPKRQRLAILGYLHDQPDEELAAVMGISERTVRVHRFEAIKALRARLGGKS
jgi:RNA polymerase sigma-70 factor (ECF subfamily)